MDDIEASFADALRAEHADEAATKPPNVEEESTAELAGEAAERAQAHTKVGRAAEQAGASIMARARLPAIVATAKKKEEHALAAVSAKRKARREAKKQTALQAAAEK